MDLKIGVKLLPLCQEELENNAEKGTLLINNDPFCRWHNHLNPDIKKNKWTE